ncbi:MAG: hypothetical protein HQL38_09465 [Alphaproteobacteria bacterium]|nr:hypothetical protein [Alphaproteobacteria bacterium]MBF0392896.1 hypothetical protein [Alphaproteobacteria bacterium]
MSTKNDTDATPVAPEAPEAQAQVGAELSDAALNDVSGGLGTFNPTIGTKPKGFEPVTMLTNPKGFEPVTM